MVAAASPILTPRRLALGALALGVAGVSGALVTVYLQREAIGVRFALDYLRAHGVPAEIHLDRLDLKGAAGSLRLGPWWRPDLSAPHVEVRFRALPAGRKGLGAPQVSSLELDRPVLRGAWRDGRLQFGTLQSLIDQAAHGKPSGEPPPDLHVRDGRLILATPAGQVVLALDADVEGGRVRQAHVRLQPVDLSIGGVKLAAVQGVAHAEPLGGGRLHLTAAFGAARGHGEGAAASGLTLTAEGVAPDGGAAPADGEPRPLDASLHLKAGRAELQPAHAAPLRVRGADVTLDLDGALDTHNSFSGRLRLGGTAAELAQGEALANAVKLTLVSTKAEAGAPSGRLSASGPFTAELAASGGRLASAAGPVTLGPVRLSAGGRVALDRSLSIDAAGALQGSGGLARPAAERLAARVVGGVDPTASAAVALALADVRLDAPSYALRYDSRAGTNLRLSRGLTAGFRNGSLSLQPIGGAAVVQTAARGEVAGALSLALRVKGLPSVDAVAPAIRTGPQGTSLRLSLDAQGGFGPLENAALRFDGALSGRGGAWSGVAARCAEVRAGAVRSAGKVMVRDVAAEVCPVGSEPLFGVDPTGWRTHVQLEALALTLPDAQLKAGLQSADVTLAGGRGAPTGEIALRSLALQDLSPTPRVRPLLVQGGIGLGGGTAEGRLNLALAQGSIPLGALTLQARLADASGTASFQSEPIRLSQKGLKPDDIVPALARTLPDADGVVQLNARAAFTRTGVTASAGELRTDGLSFKSPAGRLDGLKGVVELASLQPLQSAPDQTLQADKLETLLPLTAIRARFTLTPQAVDLSALSAQVAGGDVSLDPIHAPLAPGSAISGEVRLKGVALQQALSAFNLSNAVTLDAHVDGELPFTLQTSATGGPPSLRIAQGRIYADGPGRLTIQRQALGAAVATAGAAGAQPNAVQDFAYQALENLAFSKLEASVASRPAGRLGVVFHVVGRHDPKVDRPTRIGLLQLLRGHAFDKPLPLPKGTPVDLTLDTSLNLDDLLASYAALNRGSGSAKVQP